MSYAADALALNCRDVDNAAVYPKLSVGVDIFAQRSFSCELGVLCADHLLDFLRRIGQQILRPGKQTLVCNRIQIATVSGELPCSIEQRPFARALMNLILVCLKINLHVQTLTVKVRHHRIGHLYNELARFGAAIIAHKHIGWMEHMKGVRS